MKPKVLITRHLPEPAIKELVKFCEVEIWDRRIPPPYEYIKEKVEEKEGLICLLTDRIDATLMDAGAGLKVISQCAAGYDNIDVTAAIQRGIVVGNTPGVLTEATADFAFMLLMAAARRVTEAQDYIRAGKWETWNLTNLLGQEVFGATMGIVGFGRIGQAVAKRARGFDMRLLYYDIVRQPEAEMTLGVEFCSFNDLVRKADFISLHVNLTPNTRGLIDRSAFNLMKPTAVLINTGRGPLEDSDALYEALKSGQIAAAALDVTAPEPLPADHKLLQLTNLIITPHIASATVTSRNQMVMMAIENLIAGVQGKPLPYLVS
ncbi:MAG: D-glycerate dehydrogenase [Anaerolineaceae bacterium]|nr:D-glycerate dehydrogenase [Anaerolineaceae bacterium]